MGQYFLILIQNNSKYFYYELHLPFSSEATFNFSRGSQNNSSNFSFEPKFSILNFISEQARLKLDDLENTLKQTNTSSQLNKLYCCYYMFQYFVMPVDIFMTILNTKNLPMIIFENS